MQEVKNFVFEDNNRNKYDWDTILNGKVWKVDGDDLVLQAEGV